MIQGGFKSASRRTERDQVVWPAWFFIPIRVPLRKIAWPNWRYFTRRTRFNHLIVASCVVGVFCFVHYLQYHSSHFISTSEFIEIADGQDFSPRTDFTMWSDSKSAESAVAGHWDEIRESMKSAAIGESEINGVFGSSRHAFGALMWPKFARRGWVNDRPAWVFKAVWPQQMEDAADTANADRQMCSKLVVISAEAPYLVQATQAGDPSTNWSANAASP